MYSVYALGDPRTQQIRYIGIAKDVYKRYAQHLNHPHPNDAKNAWMKEIKQAGMVPTLTILEGEIDEAVISEREKHWIQHYLALGVPLTNYIFVPHQGNKHFLLGDISKHLVLEDKLTYNIQELFNEVTIAEVACFTGLSQQTIARIRDGERAQRYTANKLLLAMSKVYDCDLNIRNVTGINVMVNKKLETQSEEQQEKA